MYFYSSSFLSHFVCSNKIEGCFYLSYIKFFSPLILLEYVYSFSPAKADASYDVDSEREEGGEEEEEGFVNGNYPASRPLTDIYGNQVSTVSIIQIYCLLYCSILWWWIPVADKTWAFFQNHGLEK